MSRFYYRYMNQPRLTRDKPHKRKINEGVQCPGHKFDPKNKKPGGYNRFERWYSRSNTAKRLYWKKNNAGDEMCVLIDNTAEDAVKNAQSFFNEFVQIVHTTKDMGDIRIPGDNEGDSTR